MPIPSSSLPSDSSESVAAIRASTAGWRFMTLLTKLPTRRRFVRAAAAARRVQHSSTGSSSRPRLTKWSHDQTVRKPAASTRSADWSHHVECTPIAVRSTPIGIGAPGLTRRASHLRTATRSRRAPRPRTATPPRQAPRPRPASRPRAATRPRQASRPRPASRPRTGTGLRTATRPQPPTHPRRTLRSAVGLKSLPRPRARPRPSCRSPSRARRGPGTWPRRSPLPRACR